ncbi:MAG: amidase, partial [Bryobacteraceae bacterium]|nr:amidase [Bryobacteraceae bacterium]
FGAMPLSWTMDKIGPMCRSAEDCGHVLAVIAGKDENDPGTAGKSFYFSPQYQRPLNQLRIGFAAESFGEWSQEAMRPVFEAALGVLRGLGSKFVPVQMAPDLPYGSAVSTVIGAEGSSVFEELIESGRVDELADAAQVAGLRAALEIPARDYLRAMRVRRLVQTEFRRVFMDCDLLIAPSRTAVANKVSERLDGAPPPAPAAAAGAPVNGIQAIIGAGNLAGLPALSLPCGFAGGMPVGLQLVGRPFSENLLLSVGMQFQKATDFHRQRPKLG